MAFAVRKQLNYGTYSSMLVGNPRLWRRIRDLCGRGSGLPPSHVNFNHESPIVSLVSRTNLCVAHARTAQIDRTEYRRRIETRRKACSPTCATSSPGPVAPQRSSRAKEIQPGSPIVALGRPVYTHLPSRWCTTLVPTSQICRGGELESGLEVYRLLEGNHLPRGHPLSGPPITHAT